MGTVKPIAKPTVKPTTKPATTKSSTTKLASTTFPGTTTTTTLAACPVLDSGPPGCAGVIDKRKSVFLSIMGLRHRMLFDTTAKQVIHSLAQEGFRVDVYISLVQKPDKVTWRPARALERELPHTRNLTKNELHRHYADMIQEQGGCLVCFFLRPPEVMDRPPNTEAYLKKMQQYSPVWSAVGMNVLRLWRSREELWSLGLEVEKLRGERYTMGMWSRDDTRWVGPLTPMMRSLRCRALRQPSQCGARAARSGLASMTRW